MKRQAITSGMMLAGVLAAIGFVLFASNPDRIGPIGITIFFLLVFIAFFIIFDFIWRVSTRGRRQPRYNMYFIAVLAGIPTLLIGLQSLRQLQIRDVGIVLLLAVIIIFYLSKKQDN